MNNGLWFRLHRWAVYLVALQVLAWVVGGAVFAWLPFNSWVKRATVAEKPVQALPPQWTDALRAGLLTPDLQGLGALLAVSTAPAARGPVLKLKFEKGERSLRLDGAPLAAPDPVEIGRFARMIYTGPGGLVGVQRMDGVPRRLGIVRELGGRRDVWVAQFDDRLATRLYFDGSSGEFITARSHAWVVYDFFWRLHVMDYSSGEDFNNPFLRVSSMAALALVATGLVLAVLALLRAHRRRRARARA